VLSISVNVIYITFLISIGNSKGVCISKSLLKNSGLGKDVKITSKSGEIRITDTKSTGKTSETTLLSERVLAKDWLRPEEDKAWASLR